MSKELSNFSWFTDHVQKEAKKLSEDWYDSDYIALIDDIKQFLSIKAGVDSSMVTSHSPANECKSTPSESGVYVVWDLLDDRPYLQWIYVGMSKNVKKRVTGSRHIGRLHPYFCIQLPESKARKFEHLLITHLCPRQNMQA